MLVKNWMRKGVITLDVDDSMHKAVGLMREYRPPLLPVMKEGGLVGVVTDRDLKRASASDATALELHELLYLTAKIRVEDIMTKNPITIPPDYTLEEAAAKLLVNNISGMPVVDEHDKIVGIISKQEIFLALISLTGFGKRGIHLAFDVEDRPGSIKEVTDVIRDYGGRLVSLLSSYERARAGNRRLYVRAWAIDRSKVPDMLDDLRKVATLLYIIDHRDNKREEYINLNQVA